MRKSHPILAGIENVSPYRTISGHSLYAVRPPAMQIDQFLTVGGIMGMTSYPGVGKAAPLDEPVLTPGGWRPIGSLHVGDRVIGANGKPTIVTGVFDRGQLPVHILTFDDGARVRVSEDHLWLTRTRQERRLHRPGRVRTTREIMDTLDRGDGGSNHTIPYVAPVCYDSVGDRPIDAYFLGLFLGDGCRRHSMFSITSAESDIQHRVTEYVEFRAGHVTWRGMAGHIACAALRRDIRALGLEGCGAWEKFIPLVYQRAPIAERIALLRGLMDSDGSVSGSGIDFATSSPQLSRDIHELVGGLGGVVLSSYSGPTHYTKDGESVECRVRYRSRLVFRSGLIPVSSNKHMCRWSPPSRLTGRYIVESKSLGLHPCRCISVSAVDQMYVMNHYAVTHNTWLAMEVARAVASGTPFLGRYRATRGGVLFVGSDASLEDYAGQWTRLTRAVEEAVEVFEPVRFLVQSTFMFEDRDEIRKLIRTHQAFEWGDPHDGPDGPQRERGLHVVVFDTLSRLTRANQNDNTEMEEVFRNIRLFAEATNAAVVLLHHNAKKSEFNDGSDWRGAMSQIGALDSWVHLAPHRKDKYLVGVQFKKFRGVTPPDFAYRMAVLDPATASLAVSDEPVTMEQRMRLDPLADSAREHVRLHPGLRACEIRDALWEKFSVGVDGGNGRTLVWDSKYRFQVAVNNRLNAMLAESPATVERRVNEEGKSVYHMADKQELTKLAQTQEIEDVEDALAEGEQLSRPTRIAVPKVTSGRSGERSARGQKRQGESVRSARRVKTALKSGVEKSPRR